MTRGAPKLVVYRVDLEQKGQRKVWAVVAPDFVEAARKAAAAASAPGDRVLAVHPIGELL